MKAKGQRKIKFGGGGKQWGGTVAKMPPRDSLMDMVQEVKISSDQQTLLWRGKKYANNEDGKELLSSAMADLLNNR